MNSRNIILFKRVAFVTHQTNSADQVASYFNGATLLRIYRIATSVFFFIAGFTFATWASRIPDIQNKLHLSDGGLGAVLFALPVGLMISLPISGWLVSHYGKQANGYFRRAGLSIDFNTPGFVSNHFAINHGFVFIWNGRQPHQHRYEYAGCRRGEIVWKICNGFFSWTMEPRRI